PGAALKQNQSTAAPYLTERGILSRRKHLGNWTGEGISYETGRSNSNCQRGGPPRVPPRSCDDYWLATGHGFGGACGHCDGSDEGLPAPSTRCHPHGSSPARRDWHGCSDRTSRRVSAGSRGGSDYFRRRRRNTTSTACRRGRLRFEEQPPRGTAHGNSIRT